MDRDIILILTGGLIGLVSSLATIFLTYWLDGMRLRRRWEREDQQEMTRRRADLEAILAAAQSEMRDERTPDDEPPSG